jgi:soluble lytic murein transglycosylase-like protein
MGKPLGILAVFAVWVLSFAMQNEAQAEMYVCVDRNGKTSYTNIITSQNCHPLRDRPGIRRRPNTLSSRPSQSTTLRSRLQAKSSSYDRHISRSSKRYDVDPFLIKAVIKTESDFDCFAISKAGAQGLMQLMPATAKELNVQNPFNPYENIDGGTRYLRDMLDIFDGNVPLSLAAYNAGPTRVMRLQKIPRIPETIRYVKKVLAHYKGYRGSLPQSRARLSVAEIMGSEK